MNQPAQQISPDPARDFANAILAETNGARDLIELLHEISQGNFDANLNDRISATNTLMDRGFGKCPKSTPILSQARPEPEPALSLSKGPRVEGPVSDDGHTSDSNLSPAPDNDEPKAPKEPESPRLVSQLDDSLNQSLGPPPKAHTPSNQSREPVSPESFDPFSIQSSIQDYILTITNNGQTLRSTLMEIAFADPEDASAIPSHRRRAATLLIDRALGTNPTAAQNGLCPDCRRMWTNHPGSPDHPEPSGVVAETEDETVPDPKWVEAVAEVQRMKDEGILNPDPNAPKYDFSTYFKATDEEIAPYAAEVAAAFRAELELQDERRAMWPEIEERRRKKLAQIYPSHSDGEQPDT